MSIELRYSVYYSDTVEIDVNPSETLNLTEYKKETRRSPPGLCFFLVSPLKKTSNPVRIIFPSLSDFYSVFESVF